MSPDSKGCFVTVGATAAFNDLVIAALSPTFICALQDAGYTRLVLQYGLGESCRRTFLDSLKRAEIELGKLPLDVEGFDLKRTEFRKTVKDVVSTPKGGLLVAHAGTGSLMEGLALGVPTILVPNSSLAENHQAELANEFEKVGYCIHGDIKDLASAVYRAEKLKVNADAATSSIPKSTIWTILDQEMGFTDRYLD